MDHSGETAKYSNLADLFQKKNSTFDIFIENYLPKDEKKTTSDYQTKFLDRCRPSIIQLSNKKDSSE